MHTGFHTQILSLPCECWEINYEEVFDNKQMCFIWLRCSCQASEASSDTDRKVMIEIHWPNNENAKRHEMRWKRGLQNLLISAENTQWRRSAGKRHCRHGRTAAVKRKVGANDMPDKKQPSPEHLMTFPSEDREPVPCILSCFWVSLCSKETVSLKFLINVCPCWQALWMRHSFLPIMAQTRFNYSGNESRNMTSGVAR